MNLYSPAQIQSHEKRLFADGVASCALMEQAGLAVWRHIERRWSGRPSLVVVVGPGNNGGDGLVIARLAREAGWPVSLAGPMDLERFKGDAAIQAEKWRAAGGGKISRSTSVLAHADLVVDALFGIGLSRAVDGEAGEWVAAINAVDAPVVSVDVPSGLDAATGQAPGPAVKAELTVTFIAAKFGLFTGDGCEYAGEVCLESLDMPPPVEPPLARLIDHSADPLPKRHRNSHKGTFGSTLVLGGNLGMSGAARLAGEAALRVGSGKVFVGTRHEHAALLNIGRPELMVHGIADEVALQALLAKATVLALGPGLGQDDWAKWVCRQAMQVRRPMVLDADALWLIDRNRLHRDDVVYTPHPGEAAAMLGTTPARIQANRLAAVQALQREYGGVVVLKGAGTLVADKDSVTVCPAGNPGMASGGMGDVLTGVIAGLLAQGLSASEAARRGVCLHAVAADQVAAAQGERGLLASDLFAPMQQRLNQIEGA